MPRTLTVVLSDDDQKLLEEVKVRRGIEYGQEDRNDSELIRALIREEADVRRIYQGGQYQSGHVNHENGVEDTQPVSRLPETKRESGRPPSGQ